MNNDADQKPKWREWWLPDAFVTITTIDGQVQETRLAFSKLKNATVNGVIVEVIEAAPALAEIESLRAENAELKKSEKISHEGWQQTSVEWSKVQTKLSAATAQMENMAQALIGLQLYDTEGPEAYDAEQAIAQYEQFKKDNN